MEHEQALPFDMQPIFVDWRRPDVGGVRVTSWTDGSGNPYIGVFNLTREGKPTGLPCWFERRRFMSFAVIGFDDESKPVKVFLDAEVTGFGLKVKLQLPWLPRVDYFYHRHVSARWYSEAPLFGFRADPASDPPANHSLMESAAP